VQGTNVKQKKAQGPMSKLGECTGLNTHLNLEFIINYINHLTNKFKY